MPMGEPLDPSYEKFSDGFNDYILHRAQYFGLRWAPWSGGGQWHVYSVEKYDFFDYGVLGPPSPLEKRWKDGQPIWEFLSPFNSLLTPAVGNLWKAVTAVFERWKGERPWAVWNPYDGSWRDIRTRDTAPAPQPGPSPQQGPRLNPTFVRRAQELKAEYEAGLITDEVYRIRLQELERANS